MMRRVLSVLAVGLVTALAVPAAAGAAPGFVETAVSDPITALPPVSAPDTPHCTVTAMRHDFANSYGVPFTGTLVPPAACPGPWTKVVLDWTGSVAGRQFDRLLNVFVANTEVFRSSTPEPTPTGITWHVAKDISEFIPLLRTSQPLTVDLGNIVDNTYTGVFHTTLSVTYYRTGRRYPPAQTADAVVSLAQPTATNDGAYTLGPGGTATTTMSLPRDITAARLEVYARGGGCDEQWFTAVPSDLAAKYPDFLCGGGPYREVQVTLDGLPAGVAQVYPVVYTGGIVPTLWRPVPAIDAFVTQPYTLDLTPFAALLSNGRPHTVTLTPYGDNDYWLVDATLFLDENPRGTATTGALTMDSLTLAPTVATIQTPQPDGSTLVSVRVDRAWTISGYVNTPHGTLTTTVRTQSAYTNTDRVSDAGKHQVVRQRDAGTVTVTGGASVRRDTWSYPIDVDATVVSFVDGNNYDLRASVAQGRQLSTWDRGRLLALTDDSVTATGVLARTAGTVTESDGSAVEHYTGTDDTGRCYDRLVTADHGLVTGDRLRRCRLP